MCWKCCLCLCNCSNEVTQYAAPNRASAVIELTSRGAAKNQDKNWTEAMLVANKTYLHCSGTGPNIIMKPSTGLDPAFGKESITINGGAPGKYILAFPFPVVGEAPSNFPMPKPCRLLWEESELEFGYIFQWAAGKRIFAKGGYQEDKPVETGFNELIPSTVILHVYRRDKHNLVLHPITAWGT